MGTKKSLDRHYTKLQTIGDANGLKIYQNIFIFCIYCKNEVVWNECNRKARMYVYLSSEGIVSTLDHLKMSSVVSMFVKDVTI